MKTCSKCGSDGPFPKNKGTKSGLSSWCAGCSQANTKRWAQDNKAHVAIESRKRKLKTYGTTPIEWEKRFVEQGKCCAICKRTEPGYRGWATDHDHVRLHFRGILCSYCNLGLGNFVDSSVFLIEAAKYIEHWRRVHEG